MCTTPRGEAEASEGPGGGAPVAGSPVQRWLAGRLVLVTGATGFVGQALVEKLLRASDAQVVALVRPKRGLAPDARLRQLKASPVLERVRRERPSALSRLSCVCGDVGAEGLGLSPDDRRRICADAALVFHAAATVRFDEPLRIAHGLNAQGTHRIIELCRDMPRLQALVHVSTAFANADRKRIDERVYPPPAQPQHVVDACSALDDDALQVVWERMRGKHPNTYTFTKALAEWEVQQATDIPSAIVRPSIVTAAWREPEPGWVEGVSGVTGIMTEIGRGTIRSIICDDSLVMDLIPVDIVVNTLIAAAFKVAHDEQRIGPLVVHCTTGERNPVLWSEFGVMTQRHAIETPSRHVMWYPGFRFRTWRPVHALLALLTHTLPALLLDLVLRARGDKPFMLKLSRRFARACAAGEFFALHEWHFSSEAVEGLLRDGGDRQLFPTDVSPMDWDTYVRAYMLGIRRFVLKDAPDTLPGARRKLRTLYWVHRMTQVFTVAVLIKCASFR